MSASPTESTDRAAFVRLGPAAASPVVIAVPHAGRDYPPALLAAARVPRAALEALEDRHADLLAQAAAEAGATVLIARRARTWIDLNRGEREIDRTMLVPTPPTELVDETAKVRAGLGLVPRRSASGAELWRERIPAAEIPRRIETDHRPWHAALADALDAARRRFCVAVLLDLHSMPPLPPTRNGPAARIVIGDRQGRSAAAPYRTALRRVAEAARHGTHAINHPYAGGQTLDRHGDPVGGIHALQVEIDRSLYLAPGLREPGPGLAATTALVARMARALADCAEDEAGLAIAAE